MNDAIQRFTPSTNWVSALLLTVFVFSFGIFAEAHVREGVQANAAVEPAFCSAGGKERRQALVRFH